MHINHLLWPGGKSIMDETLIRSNTLLQLMTPFLHVAYYPFLLWLHIPANYSWTKRCLLKLINVHVTHDTYRCMQACTCPSYAKISKQSDFYSISYSLDLRVHFPLPFSVIVSRPCFQKYCHDIHRGVGRL